MFFVCMFVSNVADRLHNNEDSEKEHAADHVSSGPQRQSLNFHLPYTLAPFKKRVNFAKIL